MTRARVKKPSVEQIEIAVNWLEYNEDIGDDIDNFERHSCMAVADWLL